MPVQIGADRALAWRLARHALLPVAEASVPEVIRRVVALRGWPSDGAELAAGVRRSHPESGALERALDAGELIRSYAFRGGSYVFAHAQAADLLAVRTITRIWETRRWQQQGGLAIDDWQPLREAVREALAAGPLTRAEVAAHLAVVPAVRELAAAAASGAGADSLYKPLHWWGDICFGPARGRQATFRWLRDDPRWPGLPEVDEAGWRSVLAYLGGYGPATIDNLVYWFTEGLGVPRRRVLDWLAALGDEVTRVRTVGVECYARSVDLDELSRAEPSDAVRLLPGFDPWVFGPGTADVRIVAPERRALATRGANLVIRGGVVGGVWRQRGREVSVSWFGEAGPPPASLLAEQVDRLAGIRGAELRLTVQPLAG